MHVKTFSVCFFHFLSMSQMEVTGSCKNSVHILHQLYQKNFSGSVGSGLGEYFLKTLASDFLFSCRFNVILFLLNHFGIEHGFK